MSAFYKAVLVCTLKGLIVIISGRASIGVDGGDGVFFVDNIRLCEGYALAHH